MVILAVIVRILANPVSNVFQKQLAQRSAEPLFTIVATHGLLTAIALPFLAGLPLGALGMAFWTNMVAAVLLAVVGYVFLRLGCRSHPPGAERRDRRRTRVRCAAYRSGLSPTIIETTNLGKTFRGKPAVRGVSLDVARGSVYAFLGPNGAGKTTTIRLLLGLSRPDAGTMALFGLPMPARRGEILTRTGSLVESPSLYPHLTARENLEIPRRILGAPRTDIDRVLAIAGLQNAGGKLVRAFSLGMKQRLGLAQAMLGRRELLILDEPTNGLDPAGITEMRILIRRLPADEGITVFLSSHLLGEVEQVATHVGILSQGSLVFQGPTAAVSALRQSRLRIRVGDVERAGAVLRARGWMVYTADGALVTEDCAAAGAINRALVEAGHDVHHLAVETASLEDVFLGMTNAEVQ